MKEWGAELLDVMKMHAERYPLMTPQDAVKLAYQNELGCGHLVTDARKCAEYLRYEIASAGARDGMPAVTGIGNGFARVDVGAVSSGLISFDGLLDAFVRSAAEYSGSMTVFEEKLSFMLENSGSVGFPFGRRELSGYLSEYTGAGCPMVSHSEGYRSAYSPAYRVVLLRLLPKSLRNAE